MLHTPTFDIDEKALKVGSGLMAWLALKELSPTLNPSPKERDFDNSTLNPSQKYKDPS
jgi:hypothetical protein